MTGTHTVRGGGRAHDERSRGTDTPIVHTRRQHTGTDEESRGEGRGTLEEIMRREEERQTEVRTKRETKTDCTKKLDADGSSG